MFRRICLLCLLCWLSLFSNVSCYEQTPNFPQYKEYYKGGILTKASIDHIFLITDTGKTFTFESLFIVINFLYNENDSIAVSCIEVIQPNNANQDNKDYITRNLSSAQIITDTQTLNYTFSHKQERGLEYVTDYFFTTPSDVPKIYNVFNAPTKNIVLRLVDLNQKPHDYFLNASFVEMTRQATH